MTTLKTKKGQVREGLRLHESLNFQVKELILKKSHNRGFKVLERRKSGDKVRLLFLKKKQENWKVNWIGIRKGMISKRRFEIRPCVMWVR